MSQPPSPYEAALRISNNLGGIMPGIMDKRAIEDILSRSQQAQTPEDINSQMNEVLQRVTNKDTQKTLLGMLQDRAKQKLQGREKGNLAEQYKKLGLNPELASLPPAVQNQIIKNQSKPSEEKESQILSKYLSGEQLSSEERASLSPTSLRTLVGAEKPTFEPTEERLEAERVSKLASDIENDYQAYLSENQRLNRMEKLSEKGNLSTPLMAKTLQAMNLPLGILGNPDSEEYSKLEADFLRDVRNVFPGGRITNYEIQSYLKTVPSLMNSSEGKKSIIRNRKLVNEAKKLRYDAYKDILKENKGRKPRNMGLMIQERIGPKLMELENQFKEGVQNEIEKFQQPIRMLGPEGKYFNIPPNKLEQAINEGFRFS